MKNLRKVLALMLALVLVLAACGGKDDPTVSPEPPEDENGGETGNEAGEEPNDDEEVDLSKEPNLTDKDTLVVGSTDLNGDFINGFGNSAYDVWVKLLLGNYDQDLGYSTYYYDENGEFKANMTVLAEEPETKENEDGSKTYSFTINDNLVWNDGTPITAKDYVFGTLFKATPEWLATGAQNSTAAEDLLGFKAYHAGETREFPGIKLTGDYTFEATIDKDSTPYFYEVALIASSPVPSHRYAENLDVNGSELVVKEGYEISDEDRDKLLETQQLKVDAAQQAYDEEMDWLKSAGEDEGYDAEKIAEFEEVLNGDYKAYLEEKTAEDYEGEPADPELISLIKLKMAVDDEEALLNGYKDGSIDLDPLDLLLTAATNDIAFEYRFAPDVTAGPYNFVSFENNMVKLALNDKFVGNFEGKKPSIKNIIIQTVQTKLDVDLVLSGNIDIANSVIEGDKINKAKDNADKVSFSHYYRNGYGVMPILTDMGATKYKGVRQAIAFSLDRDEFVQTIAEGYGSTVDGAYGVDQWEYVEKADELAENLIHYTRNEDSANAALDTTPYIYEADGTTPWDPEKAIEAYNNDSEGFDYWRYDSDGNKLRVIHEGTVDLNVSELIQNQLPDQAKKIGMQYIFNPVDFATMLNHYYYPNADDPDAPTVFNMGTNFSTPNDPYYQFNSSQIGADNTYRVNDPEVDEITENMRNIDPSDRETWVNGWYDFQIWYNDYMPAVPLYGNDYHDIYANRVQGLDSTPFWDWAQEICYLSLAE